MYYVFLRLPLRFPVNLSRIVYLTSVSIICLLLIIVLPIFFQKEKVDKSVNINNPTPRVNSREDPNPQIKGESAKEENLRSASSIYLGMWTQGFFDPQNFILHTGALKSLEDRIGKKVAIAHYYRGWEELEKPQVISELNAISANGWRPMISANPYFFDKCQANGQNLYRAIANGNCDNFMRAVAKNLKSFGKPLFLRFAWEPNINAMEWGILRVGATSADFISAWRKFHDITKSEGATNITWVFSPNVGGNIAYKDLYPGDSYVDWVGLDGYNWGTTQSWSSWQTFSQVFASSYREITSVASQKPLMIAEVNSTDAGGDKAAWYTNTLEKELPANFPRVKAVVFYNEDRSAKENVNWLIDITPESLAAFKKGIAKAFYLSSF